MKGKVVSDMLHVACVPRPDTTKQATLELRPEVVLVQELRKACGDMDCCCTDMAGGWLCCKCQMLELIDEGLAKIARECDESVV